jgi:hypothetical protein
MSLLLVNLRSERQASSAPTYCTATIDRPNVSSPDSPSHLLFVDATECGFAVLGRGTFLIVEPRAICLEAFYQWLPVAQRYVESI